MPWKGILSEDELGQIRARLPDTWSFQHRTAGLDPDAISIALVLRTARADSPVPAAAPCLIDLGHTLLQTGYALFESYANGLYYRKDEAPHAEIQALLLEKYFADDAALRLYSAGEHLANAIVNMLELSAAQLKPYRRKHGGLMASVRLLLLAERQQHPMTGIVTRLHDCENWRKAIAYRNRWVHGQPPLIKGLGLQFRRGRRWKPSANGRSQRLPLSGGDPHDLTIDELRAFLGSALGQVLAASTASLDYYEDLVQKTP